MRRCKTTLRRGRSLDWDVHATISGGFSEVHFNGKNAIPYNPDGGYLDATVYGRMPNYDSPIIGFGVTASGSWDNYTITYPSCAVYQIVPAGFGVVLCGGSDWGADWVAENGGGVLCDAADWGGSAGG